MVPFRLATFFLKETFLVYPSLTNFNQRKRKTDDANDLLALSLVSIMAYVYSLGISFIYSTKLEFLLTRPPTVFLLLRIMVKQVKSSR